MMTVLVTAIGTAAGTAIVQELKNGLSDVNVLGADINQPENIVTSKDVDEFYVFPSVVHNPKEYFSFLKQFCLEHQVNYIYSIIDEEVNLLRMKEDELDQIGVKLCLADRQTVEICHYKDKFSKWVSANFSDLYIKEYSVSEIKSADYPVFIKPIEGRASIGCAKICNESDLNALFSDKVQSDYLVQEFVTGSVVAVDIVRDRKSGITNVVQRIEHLRNSSGSGIAVEIIQDCILEELCKQIASQLDLNGVVNAEFFKTDDGYKIIEINPRFPAGTKYSCMAGVNIVLDAYKIASQQVIENETPIVGSRFARRYDTYRMN